MSVIGASSSRGSKNRFRERLLLFGKASIGFLVLALFVITSAACNVDLPVFSDLKIEPAMVKVGEEVTISVTVTIERDQRIDVRLYIDGTLVETQSEFVNPSRVFSFKRIENTPGTYGVDIQGLTGSYAVDPLPSPVQSPATYTIAASSGTHGSISPVGALTVNSGSNQAFVISANVGYQVDKVMVDGVSVGAVASYSFSNVTANHAISASFANIVLPTATTSAPAFGNAISLDGVDDYVQIGDLGLNGNWTVQFWAKLTSSGAKIYYPIGLSTTNPTYSAGVFIGFNGDNWGIYDGNNSIVDSPITTNTWHHYAIAKNGTTYRMYLDGVAKTSGFLGDIVINDLVFGKRSDNFWSFPGMIDEIKISNVALASFGIGSPTTVDVNTVGLWHFDEVGGSVAADAKGVHTGTLVNGPTFVPSTIP